MKWRSVLCVFACASGRWFAEDAGLCRAGKHGGDGRESSRASDVFTGSGNAYFTERALYFHLTALSFDMKMHSQVVLNKTKCSTAVLLGFWQHHNKDSAVWSKLSC